MSSLVSLVNNDGVMQLGSRGDDVRTLQLALSQAGYRVDITQGQFTADTEYWVKQFQRQHGLTPDGIVGKETATLLDDPHADLVATATPLMHPSGFCHDDTASLIDFYGEPWNDSSLIEHVPCPWTLYYEGQRWPHPVPFHQKASSQLAAAFSDIWDATGHNDTSIILKHVRNYSGSGNYRPIRGSSRLSCHAFWAAIDFDSEALPLGVRKPASEMPQQVVDAFRKQGFYWGGDFISRADPQHFQAAHE